MERCDITSYICFLRSIAVAGRKENETKKAIWICNSTVSRRRQPTCGMRKKHTHFSIANQNSENSKLLLRNKLFQIRLKTKKERKKRNVSNLNIQRTGISRGPVTSTPSTESNASCPVPIPGAQTTFAEMLMFCSHSNENAATANVPYSCPVAHPIFVGPYWKIKIKFYLVVHSISSAQPSRAVELSLFFYSLFLYA